MMQIAVFVDVLQHASASALALLEMAGTVPALLCMPVAGWLADRVDPRLLSIASIIGQVLGLIGMMVSVQSSFAWLAVWYAVQAVASTVWAPTRQQWIYRTIPAVRVARVNASLGAVSGLMTVVGAALGGILTASDPVAALAAATAVQALALIPVLALTTARLAPTTKHRGTLSSGLTQGLSAARRLPLTWSIIWIGMAWGFIGGGYNVLLTGYAVQLLHGSGALAGGLYAIDGAGMVVGSILAARLVYRHHLPAYALAYVVQGFAWTAMFVAPQATFGAVCLAVMRIASGIIVALDMTLLLSHVPPGLRGRITSIHITTYNAVSRLALAVFSGALAIAGLRPIGIITGLLSAGLGIAWWLVQRHNRTEQRYLRGTQSREYA